MIQLQPSQVATSMAPPAPGSIQIVQPIVGPGGVTIMAPVNVVQGQNFGGGGGTVPVTSSGGSGANGGGSGSVISNQQYQSLLVQLQDNQPLRSRHSSAESEPAMRSGMAAPLVLNDGRALGGRFDEPMSSTLAHIQTGWFWSD